MKSKTIIVLIIAVICLGILGIRMLTKKTVEDGMDYAIENAQKARDEFNFESEKEDIKFAITAARLEMFEQSIGANKISEGLTYEGLNKQFKSQFGAENYTFTGPDSSGNFTLIIASRTYIIDKDGNLIDN